MQVRHKYKQGNVGVPRWTREVLLDKWDMGVWGGVVLGGIGMNMVHMGWRLETVWWQWVVQAVMVGLCLWLLWKLKRWIKGVLRLGKGNGNGQG